MCLLFLQAAWLIWFDRLHIASRDYLEYISQQKQSDAAPGEDPMMATEALGVVMIGHGEDLGDASALGT